MTPTLYRNKVAKYTVHIVATGKKWLAVQCGKAEPFCVTRKDFKDRYREVKETK